MLFKLIFAMICYIFIFEDEYYVVFMYQFYF